MRPPFHSSGLAKWSVDDRKSRELNALHEVPNLAQERTPGQTIDSPPEYGVSSIPHASDSPRSGYPSTQQSYNALVGKGPWETRSRSDYNVENEEVSESTNENEPVKARGSARIERASTRVLAIFTGVRWHPSVFSIQVHGKCECPNILFNVLPNT